MERIEMLLIKAKRKNDGKWIKGFICKIYAENVRGFEYCIIDVDEPINPNDWGEINSHIIDETTICQLTGRKDANGSDIWEHDKVHVWYTNGFEDYDEEMTVTRTKVGFAPFDWEYECDGCDLRCEITKIEITGNEFDEEV